MVSEEVFHAHGLRDGVFTHGYSLCARKIILRDLRTCQFKAIAEEEGRLTVDGGLDAFAIALV